VLLYTADALTASPKPVPQNWIPAMASTHGFLPGFPPKISLYLWFCQELDTQACTLEQATSA